jgi:lipopolysaccharide export system protein LptA
VTCTLSGFAPQRRKVLLIDVSHPLERHSRVKTFWIDYARKGGVVLFVLLVAAGASSGQETPVERSGKQLPERLSRERWDPQASIDITSEQMSADFDAHTITFTGNVEVRQADVTLTADKIVSVFGQTAQEIKTIVAEGNVRVQKGEKVATGDKAVYSREDGTITVDGNPRLTQGNDYLQGERIILFLERNQMEVQGRVKAAFQMPQGGPPGQ